MAEYEEHVKGTPDNLGYVGQTDAHLGSVGQEGHGDS
jgi:hypothetical protein